MKHLLITIITASALMGCNSNAGTNAKIEEARQAAIDSVNRVAEMEAIKQAAIDSVNIANERAEAKEKVVYIRDSENNSVASPSTETKRKRMNNTAKGALIGAGAGALTGVAVSKKKGQGAIIGGLVGAGAGAATGAIIDNKKKKSNN